MGKKSVRTIECKHRKSLFNFLHLLCLFGPLLFFIPYGYITGETTEKVTMSFTIVISIFLLIISLISDIKHRTGLHKTMMWTLIIGIIVALNSIKVFIAIMAATSILDELVFIRLRDHYAFLTKTNKEMDRRDE